MNSTLSIPKIKCHCKRELQQPRIEISCCNWANDFPYAPSVNFSIAHDGDNLYIRYRVTEEYLAAVVALDNGRVWTDSCVEFFISFDDGGYYNFEFSCIGRALLAFRKEKSEPMPASQAILDLIDRDSTLGSECFAERRAVNSDDGNWELNVRIPKEAFFAHHFDTLAGVEARGNFFKCGDDLTQPHFLSWSPISHPTPNFHLPAFFGTLRFE